MGMRLAGVAIVLVLEACSAPRPSTEPAEAPTPTPTPTQATLEGHGLFINGDPCPPDDRVSLPPGSGCPSFADGDLDGDGSVDRLIVYASIDDRRLPLEWFVRADLGDGRSLRIRLGGGHEQTYPRAVGAVDADGDGLDDVFVKISDHVYHSGGSPVLGIFKLHDGELVRVRVRGDGPLRVDIGGISTFGRGLDCRDVDDDGDRELVIMGIFNALRERPRWHEAIYEWRGAEVVRVGEREGTLKRDGYADPDVFRFYHLVCEPFDPPYPY